MEANNVTHQDKDVTTTIAAITNPAADRSDAPADTEEIDTSGKAKIDPEQDAARTGATTAMTVMMEKNTQDNAAVGGHTTEPECWKLVGEKVVTYAQVS